MVIAHLQNRAASPLGGIAGKDYTDTGQLGNVVKVQRLVTQVIHGFTRDSPLVIVVGINGANAADTVEKLVISYIVTIAETRMEGKSGDQTIRCPRAIHALEDLISINTNILTIVVQTRNVALEIVLIEIGLRETDFATGGGKGLTGTTSKLGARTNPVLNHVAIVVGQAGKPRSGVVSESNR